MATEDDYRKSRVKLYSDRFNVEKKLILPGESFEEPFPAVSNIRSASEQDMWVLNRWIRFYDGKSIPFAITEAKKGKCMNKTLWIEGTHVVYATNGGKGQEGIYGEGWKDNQVAP